MHRTRGGVVQEENGVVGRKNVGELTFTCSVDFKATFCWCAAVITLASGKLEDFVYSCLWETFVRCTVFSFKGVSLSKCTIEASIARCNLHLLSWVCCFQQERLGTHPRDCEVWTGSLTNVSIIKVWLKSVSCTQKLILLINCATWKVFVLVFADSIRK